MVKQDMYIGFDHDSLSFSTGVPCMETAVQYKISLDVAQTGLAVIECQLRTRIGDLLDAAFRDVHLVGAPIAVKNQALKTLAAEQGWEVEEVKAG